MYFLSNSYGSIPDNRNIDVFLGGVPPDSGYHTPDVYKCQVRDEYFFIISADFVHNAASRWDKRTEIEQNHGKHRCING
jgi:hypothetical protein